MNTRHATLHSTQRYAHAVGARALATTYEWEELPSLVPHLRRADPQHARGLTQPVWNVTAPMPMLPAPTDAAPVPFREPLNGLHVREIDGSEVFEHFFGRH